MDSLGRLVWWEKSFYPKPSEAWVVLPSANVGQLHHGVVDLLADLEVTLIPECRYELCDQKSRLPQRQRRCRHALKTELQSLSSDDDLARPVHRQDLSIFRESIQYFLHPACITR